MTLQESLLIRLRKFYARYPDLADDAAELETQARALVDQGDPRLDVRWHKAADHLGSISVYMNELGSEIEQTEAILGKV